MIVAETILAIYDRKGIKVISYVARVNDSWFAISMIDKFMYCFEVHDQDFADYALDNGIVILFDELPENVYKCFTAAFFAIAEVAEELDKNY